MNGANATAAQWLFFKLVNKKVMNVQITPIRISEHFDTIDAMMHALHESEKSLFDQTEEWPNIREQYMRHVVRMQEESDGTCLLSFVDGQPAGFIFGYMEEEEEESRIETYNGQDLYVSDGYVVPLYRRMGLYKMMNAALERIYIERGVRRLLRFTLSSNVPMQHFLEGEGYSAVRYLYEKWLTPDGRGILPLGMHKQE